MNKRLIDIINDAQEQARDTIGSMNNGPAAWYAEQLEKAGVLVLPNTPAADVVEVVHGEWVYVHTYLRGRCSICQSPMQYDNQPYCANCGAKMDVERKEV